MAVKGLKGLQRKIEKLRKNMHDEVNKAVQDGLSGTRRAAQAQLMTGRTIHTGELLMTWRVTQTPLSTGVTRHRLVNYSPYAGYVEYGTGSRFGISPFAMLPPRPRPFKAPSHTPALTKAIRRWVMTKPGFIGPRNAAMAWRIANSIADLGTHPHPFLRPAWFTMSGALPGIRKNSPLGRRMDAAIKKAVKIS